MYILTMNQQDEIPYTCLANTKQDVLAIVQGEICEYLSDRPELRDAHRPQLEKVWNDVDSLISRWNKRFSLKFELREEEPLCGLSLTSFNVAFPQNKE